VFVNRCHNEQVPRAFNAGELNVIHQGMLAHGYAKLMEKANTINLAVVKEMMDAALAKVEQEEAPEKTDMDQLIDAVKESLVELKHKIAKRNATEVVKNISAPGFTSYVQNTVIQSVNGLDGRFFGKYAEMVLRRVNSDNATRAALEKHLNNIPNAEANKWHMFRTIFSSTNSSSASYINLMIYKDGNTGKFKIFNIQLSNSFKLAQNVLVVRTSQSMDGAFTSQTERIETRPKEVTETDLKQVLDFFDLIAMEKFIRQFGGVPALH